MAIRLHLPVSYYQCLATEINQFRITDNFTFEDIILDKMFVESLIELKKKFIQVAIKNDHLIRSDKKVICMINNSNALLFFRIYNGNPIIQGLFKVASTEACRQIENHLLRKTEILFPNHIPR